MTQKRNYRSLSTRTYALLLRAHLSPCASHSHFATITKLTTTKIMKKKKQKLIQRI